METMTRAQPVPVVRLIVPDPAGRVLLLRRKQTSHAPGKWCLPGGKVDYGQTVEEAAARELREETSLLCTEKRFLFYQDSLPRESGAMHCINLYFECAWSGEVRLNPESSEYAWVGPSELAGYEIVFRNDEGLERYWREAARRGSA
jgi:8-oxo-dGTP pyrophosphatase MutT (NUDIX family)